MTPILPFADKRVVALHGRYERAVYEALKPERDSAGPHRRVPPAGLPNEERLLRDAGKSRYQVVVESRHRDGDDTARPY